MREAAFRGYAETTRRALRRKLGEALESRKQREADPMHPVVPDRQGATGDATGPTQWTRGGLFARELGDDWVEVAPGIYERAA